MSHPETWKQSEDDELRRNKEEAYYESKRRELLITLKSYYDVLMTEHRYTVDYEIANRMRRLAELLLIFRNKITDQMIEDGI